MWTIERKELVLLASGWERIEAGWECPQQFSEQTRAVLVAQALAVRHDGHTAFRVVDAEGVPLVTFWIRKALYQVQSGFPGTAPVRQFTRLASDAFGGALWECANGTARRSAWKPEGNDASTSLTGDAVSEEIC